MKKTLELDSETLVKMDWFERIMMRFFRHRIDYWVGIGYWRAYQELDELRKYH